MDFKLEKILQYGVGGCLAGETLIDYHVISKDGKVQNKKGGTIETLYRRFNNLQEGFHWQRPASIGSTYNIGCFTPKGVKTRTSIIDVMYSGIKEVYEVTSMSGHKIQATLCHRFFQPDGNYKRLEDFKPGDSIMVAVAKPLSTKKLPSVQEVNVKYHPTASYRYVDNKYKFYRISLARLIYEAAMNNLTPEEYRSILNSRDILLVNSLKVLKAGIELHHKDRDRNNNSLSNLVALSKKDHTALHQKEDRELGVYETKVAQTVLVPSLIKSIKYKGKQETYDIECADPYHNFIANDVGVHNSGKSAVILSLLKLKKYNPNMKIFYLMTERNAMAGLDWAVRNSKVAFKEEIVPVAGDITYSVIKDENFSSGFANMASAISTFSKQTAGETKKSDGTGGKEKYNFYMNVCTGLDSFKGTDYVSGETKNYKLSNLNSNAIVVIDGLTPITNGLWNVVKGDRISQNQDDYQSVQLVLANFLNLLQLAPYSVILIAHADVKAVNLGTRDQPNLVDHYSIRYNAGQALRGTLSGYFNEVIFSYQKNKDVKWATRKMYVEDGVARSMPLDQDLVQDYSLYDVFLTKAQKEAAK